MSIATPACGASAPVQAPMPGKCRVCARLPPPDRRQRIFGPIAGWRSQDPGP